jgi:hypothetical protein
MSRGIFSNWYGTSRHFIVPLGLSEGYRSRMTVSEYDKLALGLRHFDSGADCILRFHTRAKTLYVAFVVTSRSHVPQCSWVPPYMSRAPEVANRKHSWQLIGSVVALLWLAASRLEWRSWTMVHRCLHAYACLIPLGCGHVDTCCAMRTTCACA